MIKALLKRGAARFGARYDYDVGYLEHFIDTSPSAFAKLSLAQGMSRHREGIPKEPYYAAKIRAALAEDCGPCAQLAVNMALEAGLDPARVRAIVNAELDGLPGETALVLRFTDLVLAHDAEADALREKIVERWGDGALASLALAIGSTRLYPTIKYVLGHGRACQRIVVQGTAFAPQRSAGALAS